MLRVLEGGVAYAFDGYIRHVRVKLGSLCESGSKLSSTEVSAKSYLSHIAACASDGPRSVDHMLHVWRMRLHHYLRQLSRLRVPTPSPYSQGHAIGVRRRE